MKNTPNQDDQNVYFGLHDWRHLNQDVKGQLTKENLLEIFSTKEKHKDTISSMIDFKSDIGLFDIGSILPHTWLITATGITADTGNQLLPSIYPAAKKVYTVIPSYSNTTSTGSNYTLFTRLFEQGMQIISAKNLTTKEEITAEDIEDYRPSSQGLRI